MLNQAIQLHQSGRLSEAEALYRRVLAAQPRDVGALHGLGVVCGQTGRPAEAAAWLAKALALEPDHLGALSDRGVALMQLGRYQDALDTYERALALAPLATIFSNRGNALQELLRPDEALASFERALALDPQHVGAQWNKALCLLRAGRMEPGLPLYEWRKQRASWAGFRDFACPQWTGREALDGKTLLIHAEQGMGDTIQFCRYAALARARGAHVILMVRQPALVRLLQSLPVEVCGPDAIPNADYHISLLSLPLAFGTTLATIPADIPYLFAEPQRVARWRARVGAQGLRIGVCWQGERSVDDARHFAPEKLAPLAQIPGVRLISLQKHSPSPFAGIESLGEDFDAGPDAFLDSAAVMQSLDLVITVDTAMAHLAGALGRPVWVALRHLPDWRWLMKRDDSPWYPGMRLFRQPVACDWDSVMAQMQAELASVR